MIKVLGIKIIDRIKEAGLTQAILSRHSGDSLCSREAYLILHLKDDHAESANLIKELEPLGGIVIREMIFESPGKDNGRKDEEGAAEIIGILVSRDDEVVKSVQKLLTSYGCSIRIRLGVNEVFYEEKAGLIILELTGDNQQRELLERDLKTLNQVQVRKMAF